MSEADGWRGRAGFALRVGVTLAALAWILTRVDAAALGAAAAQVSPAALGVACGLTGANLLVGAARWRLLLRAYGARAVPSFATLARLHLVGFFYNTWLPGGVGGDAVRGVATRAAFGAEGVTASLAVVFVERVLGLVGLLLLVAGTSALSTVQAGWVLPGVLIGGLAGIGAVGSVAVGGRLQGALPGVLGRLAARLPRIERPGPFAAAVGLSLVSQAVGALAGHAIVSSLAPEVALSTSLVVIPVALTTSFLPFLVGGTGAREVAFVALYGAVGVPIELAVAASLLLYGSQLAVGLTGAFLRVGTP